MATALFSLSASGISASASLAEVAAGTFEASARVRRIQVWGSNCTNFRLTVGGVEVLEVPVEGDQLLDVPLPVPLEVLQNQRASVMVANAAEAKVRVVLTLEEE